jgi:hypothetical protein
MKLRVPEDIAARIEKKAKAKDRPMNRIVIDELADFPALEERASFAELLADMETTLARYGSRIVLADLDGPLLEAVDHVLAAKTDGELRARLDKLRVLRRDMLKHLMNQ